MQTKQTSTLAWFSALTLTLLSAGSAQAAEQHTLQVWIEPICPSVAPPQETQSALGALIIEGLLGTAINTAFDAAGNYFTAAAQTRSTALKDSVESTFYTLDEQGQLALADNAQGCVVLMVQGTEPRLPWFNKARERSKTLNLVDKLPHFYFEASFEPATSPARELLVRNRMLHVSSFLDSGWNYRDERAYSVALTLRSLEDYKAFGQLSFNFAGVRPGTWAESNVIHNPPDREPQRDVAIKSPPSDWTSVQRVPFLPTSGSIELAVNAQKLTAAPFQKAVRLLKATPLEPALQEPEWVVRTGMATVPPSPASRFAASLQALCDSLDKLKEKKVDLPRDARCPVSHLQVTNDLEDARAALRTQMELDWANSFFAFYNGKGCNTDKNGKPECKPPLRGQPKQGPYAWEVTVVETREPTALATALASAFSANKEKLKTAVQNEVIPSSRAAEAEKEQTAARDAVTAYRLAMLKVEEEESKLEEAAIKPRSEQLVLQANVLRAKVAANTAARTAGQPHPFEI